MAGDPTNIDDFQRLARDRMTPAAYDYYAGGANDEITLRDNREAFGRIKLQYRVLRDVSRRDISTTLLGHRLQMPVIIAPSAFHKLAHPDGELATVRAAGAAGTIMIVSTLSTTPLEAVAAAAAGPVWFQLYVYKDRGITAELVRRAQAAGCSALVLTVDAPVIGRREKDVRNRFMLPNGVKAENLLPGGASSDLLDSGLAHAISELFDQSLNWRDVAWLSTLTEMPVLIKGIVHPEDARLAVEHGAAGVIVSNHGGRQLDTAPATIDVLPQIAEAVDGRLPIVLDGGIRRGTDVIKALALGARAVAIGRPALWGLAVGGQRGVEQVLEILRYEIDVALGLCGFTALDQLRPDLVVLPPGK